MRTHFAGITTISVPISVPLTLCYTYQKHTCYPFLNAKGVCPVCRLKYLLKKLGLGKFKASDMAATVS